jgi:hypothetical protein
MTSNLSAANLQYILSQNLWQGICIFSASSRSISPANEKVVPWFVAFHLGAAHKKHRIHGGGLPKISSLHDALRSFSNKVAWRWFFRRNATRFDYSLKRRGPAPPFGEPADPDGVVFPPDLPAWQRSVSSEILSAARRCLNHNASKRWWVQKGFLQRAASEWLLDNFVAIPGDKRGIISLVTADDYIAAHISWLTLPMYMRLPASAFNDTWYQAVAHRYAALAREVTVADDSVSFRFLMSSISRGKRGLIANIGNTCKTHKPPGLVKFRFLHLSAAYSFEGLARWAVTIINRRLKAFQHLIGSSLAFMQRVAVQSFPASAVVLHFDRDDFFNTGAAGFSSFKCCFNFLCQYTPRALQGSPVSFGASICRFWSSF